MGAYYRDVVVVIELGAYIHGVLTFNGCLLSRLRYKPIHEYGEYEPTPEYKPTPECEPTLSKNPPLSMSPPLSMNPP